jgi:hypothetical protein
VFGGDTDDEEDDRPGVRPTTLSGHLSMLGPGSLNASTRRRSTLRDVRHHPTTAPLEKELLGLLECDVCSMLLYEPVTTPCQHVSKRSLFQRHVFDPETVLLLEVPQSIVRSFAAMSSLPPRSPIFRLVPGSCGQ